MSVLAIYGPSNTGKIERHLKPLAHTVDTTLVCIEPAEPVPGITYRSVPSFGVRPIGLALMAVVAFWEMFRNEFDAVVSFSLFPHGCIALAVGRLAGVPIHLGILGIDLDVHARSSYGGLVRRLLTQFDVVSVPGSTHRRQLEAIGVPTSRSVVLANAIDVERFAACDDDTRPIDFLWVGRFGPEKDPFLFLDAIASLKSSGHTFRAVMLGDGPLKDKVERAVHRYGLDEVVDRPGWIDETACYYQQAKVFVLTSRRDALPLTLLEAMATGVVPVVPRVGNITDAVEDGHNGIVLDDPTGETIAGPLSRLLTNDERRKRLSDNALAIRDRYSYAAAREDWLAILDAMGIRQHSRTEPAVRG